MMALWKLFSLVVLFQAFFIVRSSMVKVIDGGYEDIVVAISPAVNEDVTIIENLQNIVNDASTYLFEATGQRLFIRSVKILIPLNWTHISSYGKPRTETYEKADVIIASPFLKYGDEPYTMQYGACGKPGRYIHFTSDYMKNDKISARYGPRGRLFVHEWAHHRWGIFDEYNNEVPYYIAGNGQIEATRCSLNITGVSTIEKCNVYNPSDCKQENCKIDPITKLYEEGCNFVLDKIQSAPQSIMYAQSIDSVTKFCDANTHNVEAPTLQNRMCNLRSTWEVIMDSTDIQSTPPRANTSIPAPSYSLLQYRARVVTLVLDVSGSMAGYDRIGRLYQAADVFLIQIIEHNSYVGIVQFSSSASIITNPLKITDDGIRKQLKSFVPKSSTGATNICSGIMSGLLANKKIDGSTYGTEIVLLTDGEDNYDTTHCYSNITDSGAIIHVIAVGPDEARAVKDIARMTGGILYLATDKIDANGLIDAFSGLVSQDGDIFKQSIQLESTALNIRTKMCLNGTVFIDSSVGNDTFFLVTWQSTMPGIMLKDPSGQIYTSENFTIDTTSKSTRLSIPGTAKEGRWDYSFCNTHMYSQVLSITVNSRAVNENVPPIVVNTHMNVDMNQFPSPMVVYAVVSQGHLPVKGVKVTAIIEPATGNSATLQLLDNGAGADIAKNDGIYSRYFFDFPVNGRYALKVRVEAINNNTRLVLPRSRSLHVSGYIDNGQIVMNPSRTLVNDDDLNFKLEPFSRTVSGASFTISNVPLSPQPDIYKPEKITDLEAKNDESKIVLSWTATGDDMDYGIAASYDLRMNTNPKDLRDNFNSSTVIDISSLTPQPAGSSETFTFVLDNYDVANGTILYFALVAFDKVSQKSDVSNIVQTSPIIFAVRNPTTAITHTTVRPNPSSNNIHENLNVGYFTLLICSTVIIVFVILSITICIVSCKDRKLYSEV